MNPEGSIILTIAAVIFLSWFIFHKSLNKNRGISVPTPSYVNSSTETGSAFSSASDSQGKYDVFLSFRGVDTRHGFTDFLYTDLVSAGIYTFRDDNEIRMGEDLAPEILEALEDSKISIPIFSKNYAGSKWCLLELAHIVKCQAKGKKIFPIFYDVDASDVRNQKGSYMKAFRQHEKNFDKTTVEDWRDALETVGRYKGYVLKTETNGHQGELVKKLVRDVLLELKKNYAHIPDELVGMDHHVQEMTRLLQIAANGVRIVGVHGMGGIGKTTIAKVIYNNLCDRFDYCCILEDVRERAKQHPNGLVDLQKQLLFQIVKKDFPDIVTINDGIKKIKDVVHRKKVLILLDDVDEKSQFDKLAGECSWFHKATRIMVTTRNKEVLNALEAACRGTGLVEAYQSYEPELMSTNYSLKLFSKYAFMRDSPPEDYSILSRKVVVIAAGLPLVLVTLGSLFLGIRDNALWSAKLKKLEKVPHKDVMGTLRISFDALDDDNKKIFLDIACLFIGKDKSEPYYMWEDCGFVPEDGINTLVLRSLVKIGDDNKLRMHDQLRDLGRMIVREECLYKLSRVWQPEEAYKLLEGGLGIKDVESLILDLRVIKTVKHEQLIHVKQGYEQLRVQGKDSIQNIFQGKKYYVRCLKGQSFSQLQNLRYLRLGCVIFDKDFNNPLSNLRWLEWMCCVNYIPINLNMENLLILNLSNSTITDVWEGWNIFKVATKLKVLNLSGCSGLRSGPNLSTFKNLESLILDSCGFLSEVSGLEQLENLTNLDMMGCISIEILPDLSNLKLLKQLFLSYCSKLHDVEGLGGLVSLEHLNMTGCDSIVKLPNLSNLKMLKGLRLAFCSKLQDIESLGGLMSLEKLDMGFCVSIVRLPDLSNLTMLKVMSLTYCEKLVEFGGLGGLISLEKLVMNFCYSMERLPDLSNLGNLKLLSLFSCEKLREIEGFSCLVSLESLDLSNCISLERTLDFSCLKNLDTLKWRIWSTRRRVRGVKN